MSILLSLTEDQVFTALRSFILSVVPGGVEVVQAQGNRVPPPPGSDFVTMTTGMQERLSTNVDDTADALFTGSISGTTLTITAVDYGVIGVGSPVLGVGIADNTFVTALGSGTGGVGTYVVNNAQTISSEPIACGVTTKLQAMKVTIQLDVHGPSSGDNAVLISTMFRDEYGVDQFTQSGFDVTPLYCGEPQQLPFLNDSQQIEQRWVIDAVMQCNPVVTIPQAFADVIEVEVIDVDAAYPATSVTAIYLNVPQGPIDGSNKVFTLLLAPAPSDGCIGYLRSQGAGAFLPLVEGVDFVVSDNIVTMTQAPDTGSNLLFSYPLPGALPSVNFETPSGAVDGFNATFTLSQAPFPVQKCAGYIRSGGVGAFLPLIEGFDFTLASNVVTMVDTPDAGSDLRFSYVTAAHVDPNSVDLEIPAGVVDGMNCMFTLSRAPNPAGSCIGYLRSGGAGAFLPLVAGIDFTVLGDVVTTSAAPDAASNLFFSYRF